MRLVKNPTNVKELQTVHTRRYSSDTGAHISVSVET